MDREGVMQELVDDQSHYEISLTAGQAFVAFVLLLLSLAASFAFGLLIGRGQSDDRLVMHKEPAEITEAAVVTPKKDPGKLVEVGVHNDDFQAPTVPRPKIEPSRPSAPSPAASVSPGAPALPAYAQLLSTTDQKTAEALAAKLIEGGFTSAYVEPTLTDKGPVFRVRVKFPSESEAHTAEARLRSYSKDVWITTR